MTRKPSKALLALTASALALPGFGDKAQAQEANSDVQYRYSSYREQPLPADKTVGGNGQRYDINTHQFRLLRPLSSDYDWALDATHETMSGASPWFVIPDANGRPIQVMSGATIAETRNDVLTSLTRYEDGARLRGSAGYSHEDDYRARNLGVEYERDIVIGSTWNAGLGGSWDQLRPTDGASARFPDRTAAASRRSFSGYAGYSTTLSTHRLAQLAVNLSHGSGYLNDPYKLSLVDGVAEADRRPSQRRSLALVGRLRQFVESANAALHSDYRFYRDDWSITAHTLELAWLQNLPQGWLLSPSLRGYSQSAAYFYAPFYDTARPDGLASSDYRLSDYRALSLRLGALKRWEQLLLDVSVERYRSGHGSNPGLVDFNVASLGIRYTF